MQAASQGDTTNPCYGHSQFLGLPTAAPGRGAPHSPSTSTGWRLDPASPPALLTTGRKSCCVGGDGICREPQPSCTSIGYSQVCLPGVPVFWNILCSEPCKQQIPHCHGHRGSGSTLRAALLLFYPIPGATIPLAWKEHCSTFSHHHTLSSLLLCHETQPRAVPTGQSQSDEAEAG